MINGSSTHTKSRSGNPSDSRSTHLIFTDDLTGEFGSLRTWPTVFGYSYRNAIKGSTFTALIAGTKLASVETAIRKPVMPAKVHGS